MWVISEPIRRRTAKSEKLASMLLLSHGKDNVQCCSYQLEIAIQEIDGAHGCICSRSILSASGLDPRQKGPARAALFPWLLLWMTDPVVADHNLLRGLHIDLEMLFAWRGLSSSWVSCR